METKERYEKYLREESTQLIFKDFQYFNEEAEPISNIKNPSTVKSINKEIIKNDILKDNKATTRASSISSSNFSNSSSSNANSNSNSTYSLVKKDSIKKISSNPMPNIVIGSSMFNNMKMEKSSSLLDNRLLKLNKITNSLSSSSLLKNGRQLSSLSSNSEKENSVISMHKRTGSSSSNTKQPVSIVSGTNKINKIKGL